VGKIDKLDFVIMMFDSNRTYFFGMESYRKLQIKNGNIPGIFIKNKVDRETENNNIVNPLDYSYHISLRHGFGFDNIIDQIVQNY
jgi:predicted GTPase